MKKRWVYITSLAGMAAVATLVFVVVVGPAQARSHGRSRSLASSATGEVTPMQTITSYQLQSMHLYLGPAPASAAITASQADQALESNGIADNAGPIMETVLATCSMTAQPVSVQLPWADRPCWVISVKPAPMEISTPLGWSGSTTVTPTVQYALVDANTGQVFDEAAGTPPPQAP